MTPQDSRLLLRRSGRPRLVKLVRDRVGQFIGGDQSVSYEPIQSFPDAVTALRAKLVEEAVEYLLDPSIAELADVYEVVRALAHAEAWGMARVVAEADAKVIERGGFGGMTGMYVTTTAPARHEGNHAA